MPALAPAAEYAFEINGSLANRENGLPAFHPGPLHARSGKRPGWALNKSTGSCPLPWQPRPGQAPSAPWFAIRRPNRGLSFYRSEFRIMVVIGEADTCFAGLVGFVQIFRQEAFTSSRVVIGVLAQTRNSTPPSAASSTSSCMLSRRLRMGGIVMGLPSAPAGSLVPGQLKGVRRSHDAISSSGPVPERKKRRLWASYHSTRLSG